MTGSAGDGVRHGSGFMHGVSIWVADSTEYVQVTERAQDGDVH